MSLVVRYLRLLVIAVAIAMCPAWPDLMGHTAVMAPSADAVGAAVGGPLGNAHFVLLAGMMLGGLLLIAVPRVITERFTATVALAGGLGTLSIVAYSQCAPGLAATAVVVSAICFITLYGATFYLLAGTAGYTTIAVVSALALALKAALLPFVETALPQWAACAAVCCVPLVCSGCALLYRRLCNGVSERQEGAFDPHSYGRRTSAFMAVLIAISSVVFAVTRASSDMQLWGSGNPVLPMGPAAVLVCTVLFLVMCYATFIAAPRDLMLRFLPCLVVQLVAYALLWCEGLSVFGVSGDSIGGDLFCTYTELYSHMYFFMVMFMGLSMLGTAGVRVHGVQWVVFSSALFVILALGWTEASPLRFVVVLGMNIVLAATFVVAHFVYESDQVHAIEAVSSRNAAELAEVRRRQASAIDQVPLAPVPETGLSAVRSGEGRAHPGQALGATETGSGFAPAAASARDAEAVRRDRAAMPDAPEPVTLAQALALVAHRYSLSEREQEVLVLLVQGRTRQYIGDQLYLASGTVGSYVSRIYEKMRVHSKQELLTIVYNEMAAE